MYKSYYNNWLHQICESYCVIEYVVIYSSKKKIGILKTIYWSSKVWYQLWYMLHHHLPKYKKQNLHMAWMEIEGGFFWELMGNRAFAFCLLLRSTEKNFHNSKTCGHKHRVSQKYLARWNCISVCMAWDLFWVYF